MRALPAGLKGVGVVLVMLTALLAGETAHALASTSMQADAGADPALLDFDIPSQPLGDALSVYAEKTGLPAVFPSELTDGRMSATLRGRYRPDVALRMLLQGSGLVAEQRESRLGRTFVLERLETPAAPVAAASAGLFADRDYAGLAQARIWQQLCADPRTRPGSYTALLRFRLGTDGRLRDTRLLGSSGDAGRDAALLARMARVRIERMPPGALARRELTMAVFPRDPGGPQCAGQQGATDG